LGWVGRFASIRKVAHRRTRSLALTWRLQLLLFPEGCKSKGLQISSRFSTPEQRQPASQPRASTNPSVRAMRPRSRARTTPSCGSKDRRRAFQLLARSKQSQVPRARPQARCRANLGRMWRIGGANDSVLSKPFQLTRLDMLSEPPTRVRKPLF